MIPKIIHLDPYFPTGEATVQLVSFWDQGKNYGEYITKHASVASDYFKTVKSIPGHSIVYVLAVSSWEAYGENRNGDSFPEHPYKENEKPPWVSAEETLPMHYKSFEQFGFNYRHHCFPAGSPVLLADRTRVAIENVREGDLVETLEGTKKVARIMRRPYAGEGVQLSLRGKYEPLTGTADHPVLVYRREQVHCPHRYNYLTIAGKGCSTKACQEKRGSIGDPEWAPLSSVLPGDYLVFPKPKHGGVEINSEVARLVGWVASEGYLGNKGAIQFTFSEDNTQDISSVKECLEENKMHASCSPRELYGLTAISACSSRMHDFLSEYIQGVLSEKHITGKILEWSEESLLQMLGAYIDGDGHVAPTGKNAGQLRIRSSSPQMLYILSDVIKSLGVPATIQWDIPAGEMTSPTNGKIYTSSGSGVVTVESAYSPFIAKYSRKQFVRGGRNPQTITVGDVFLVQVTAREDLELSEDVFNLEVEGAHHYVVNGAVVHNCNRDPAKAVGKVMQAFWNPTMHRVELLIDLEDSKAPDLAERIRNGEFPPVSMGTRVKYDVCSICGNRAPTRAQYCDHLKYQMRDVIDGKKVSALNPSPKFFDISWVFRPADPNAFMLKKVAEHSYEISGASAGEYLASMDHKKIAAKKLAVIDKVVQGIPIDAKSEGIDPSELNSLQQMRTMVNDVGEKTPDFPDDVLRQLSNFSLPKIFSTLLAGHGMVLSTPEVLKITIFKTNPRSNVPEDVLDKGVAMQRSIMELFSDMPQLLDQLKGSGALNLGVENIDPKIAEIVSPYIEKRAGIGEYLKRRFLPEDYRNEPAYTEQYTLTDPSSGQRYGTTRGAAIAAHDEIAKRNLYKILGGGLLLGGAYKLVGHGLDTQGWGKLKPLLAVGLGAVGGYNLPSMGKHYMTDQGMPIPVNTELAKLSEEGSSASLVLPVFGTLGTMVALSHDYKSRLRSEVPLGHPGLPLSRRILDKVEEFNDKHPIATALIGAGGLYGLGKTPPAKYIGEAISRVKEPAKKFIGNAKEDVTATMRGLASGNTKISSYLGESIMGSGSTVLLPEINIDKLAEWVGRLLIEG